MAIFIKFEGIEGECNVANFESWCVLQSVYWELSRPGVGPRGPEKISGHVTVGDMQCQKVYDKASPKLAERICTGATISKVEIHDTTTIDDDTNASYLVYKLEKVLLTRLSLNAGDNTRPTETISLSFAKITTQYTQYNAQGEKEDNVGSAYCVETGQVT